MTRLYLVRHAQAQGNVDKVFQGSIDAPLSDLGREQLERLSERFAGVPFDVLYSSPLSRAYQTAQAVNRAWGKEIVTEPRFTEIHGGEFEGVAFDGLPGRFPEEYRLWTEEPWRFAAPGGESMEEVFARVQAGAEDVVRANRGKTVVIASHGCALRNLLCALKGWPLRRIGEVGWLENTSVTLVEYPDDRTPQIVFAGDASHLTREMIEQSKPYFGGKKVEG